MVSSEPSNAALAAYQAALLDTLHGGGDGPTMAAAIAAASDDANLAIGPLDTTLVEVAADLTRTWGRLAE